ncbi:hypothetical protein GCM10020295_42090 [Streptomyces cinereospinus]
MPAPYAGTLTDSTTRTRGGQFGILGRLVERLAQGGVIGRPRLLQQFQARLGDVGVDAPAVGGAQIALQQPTVLQPGDQPCGGALAEDDRVGDLLHLQMPALAVVLSAEHVEQGVLARAQTVPGLQGALDVCLDPPVQQGEGAPALGEGGERGVRRCHRSSSVPERLTPG